MAALRGRSYELWALFAAGDPEFIRGQYQTLLQSLFCYFSRNLVFIFHFKKSNQNFFLGAATTNFGLQKSHFCQDIVVCYLQVNVED